MGSSGRSRGLRRIPVRLGARRYEVVIGSDHLDRLVSEIRGLDCGTHPVVLTNPRILKSHGGPILRLLSRGGFPVRVLTVADTERSKSWRTLGRLLEDLAGLDGPGRRLFLILLGGGVVGDVGAAAAALYRRGIPYLQLPTTLLAQVDSSIGGKAGVDLPHGKNLAGLFYQPRLVFIDLQYLRTLPDRQFRSGLSEMVKCGVIRDPVLFSFLERTSVSHLRRSESRMAWLIARAVKVKASVVERDERETCGIRTILNLGHTFGHALEAAVRYSGKVTHGEAIAVGMRVAVRIACRMSLLRCTQAERIGRVLDRIGFPARVRGASLAEIMKAMAHDKKWSEGRRWVLPAGIGRTVVRAVPDRIARAAIRNVLEE